MARENIYREEEFPSPLIQLWHNFKSNPMVMLAFGSYLTLALLAILSPVITPFSPTQSHLEYILLPPAWSDDGNVSFLLGTDKLGRDVLSMLMHGASFTFGLSFIIVFVSVIIGMVIGSLSALTSGVKSSFLNHFLDVILAIPSLLLAIVIVAILGVGLNNTVLAITIVLIPQFIHITKNEIKKEFSKDYVLASKLDGASPLRLLRYSIFPNIIERVITQGTLAQSAAILDIAALGFLGLGAPSNIPEWGAMLSNGIDLFYIAPWTVYFPGLAILFSVIATNLVGEGLRHALKQRKVR
jgi:cationic peptide transport system permease protein